jgi:hypothetical protein
MPSEPSFNGRLPQPLRWFLLCLYTLTAASLLDVAVGFFRNDPSPFLYLAPDGFAFDFLNAVPRFAFLHSATFFTLPGYLW